MHWLNYVGLAIAGLFPLVNPLGAVPLFASLTADYPATEQRRQAIKASLFAFAILGVSLFAGQAVLNFFDISLGMLQIAGGLIVGNTAWQMSTGSSRLSHSDVNRLHRRGFKTSIVQAAGTFTATVASLPAQVSELPKHMHPTKHHKHEEPKHDAANHDAAVPADTANEPTGDKTTRVDVPESTVQHAVQDISFSPMAMPMLAGPGSIGVAIGLAVQSTAPLDTLGSLIGIAIIALLAAVCLLMAGSINNRLGPSGIDAMTRIFGFIVLGIAVALVANGLSSLFGLTLHGAAG